MLKKNQLTKIKGIKDKVLILSIGKNNVKFKFPNSSSKVYGLIPKKYIKSSSKVYGLIPKKYIK